MLEAQKRPASAGWDWIVQAWVLFKQQPLAWIAMVVILFLIAFASAMAPIIGDVLYSLFSPVLMGGMMLAAAKAANDERFAVSSLFACFGGERMGRLILLGALQVVATIVIVFLAGIVLVVLFGADFLAAASTGTDAEIYADMGLQPVLLFILIVLALALPVMMAFWFAPALVVLADCSAVDAIEHSFLGCLRNIVPFLLYSIWGVLLVIVAIIPVGLGLFILMPVIFITAFTGFADIFGPPVDDTPSQANLPGPDDEPTLYGG